MNNKGRVARLVFNDGGQYPWYKRLWYRYILRKPLGGIIINVTGYKWSCDGEQIHQPYLNDHITLLEERTKRDILFRKFT